MWCLGGSIVEKVRVTVEKLRGPAEAVYIFAFMSMRIMHFRWSIYTTPIIIVVGLIHRVYRRTSFQPHRGLPVSYTQPYPPLAAYRFKRTTNAKRHNAKDQPCLCIPETDSPKIETCG